MLRRPLVRWGLLRIALHERVSEATARRLMSLPRRWAIARAIRKIDPLQPWEQIPERTFVRYISGGNAVRLARVVDLVPPRSRIVDIGIGHGYVAGVLLRDRRPSHYCGIDLREIRIDATREMIEANGLGDRPVALLASDIFDLDEAFWRDHDPELVLLLEVLEHLSDPAAALRAIAAKVRLGTRILFTVPLHGRLESIWGHRSVFDRRRIESLARQAGLVLERVEPVLSTWSMVLARVADRPAALPSDALDAGYTFAPVPVRPDEAAPGREVRLSVPSPRVLRLDLSVEPPGAAGRLLIQGRDPSGRLILEWTGPPDDEGRAIYVLRPGRPARSLAPRVARDADAVASIDVSVEPEPGVEAALTVHRAECIDRRPRETRSAGRARRATG